MNIVAQHFYYTSQNHFTLSNIVFNGYRPLGATIKTYIDQLSEGISGVRKNRQASPEFEQLNSAIEEAR